MNFRANTQHLVKLASGLAAIGIQSIALAQSAAKHPVDLANPLVGTAPLDRHELVGNAPPPGEPVYSGQTSPGARLPHSSVEAAPFNNNIELSFPNGVPVPYYYTNPTMLGFSGGGGATYGGNAEPIVSPVVGDWSMPPAYRESYYDKSKEKASPGYYSVELASFKTQVELTATRWASLMRFTFPATDCANILVNLPDHEGHIEIVGDRTVRGVNQHSRAVDGSYFVAEFSAPFTTFGTFHKSAGDDRGWGIGDKDVDVGGHQSDGDHAGSYLTFHTTAGQQILMKMAHGTTYEQAEKRLHDELPGWNFDAVHQAAREEWAKLLDRVQIEGGTPRQRAMFYSTLFQSFASPRLLTAKGEQFTSRLGKLQVATHDRYSGVPFWDTGRNQIVLLEMLEPARMRDIMASELDAAREEGFMNTSFHGDNAVFMFLGSWKRGIPFDYAGAYQYLRNNALDPGGPRKYLAEYEKVGWISDFIPKGNPSPPYSGGKAGAATTLEYAWDDHAMAQYANLLGKKDDAQLFLKRAGNYKNVFDPSIGFVRGRTEDGKWIAPFDPQEPYYNFMMKEGSGWSTLWLEPHDVQGMINLLGGREAFDRKLDQFFSTPYTPKGICRDCTGLIGQYVQGNQPDQQAAYYYDWGGQPYKTQKLVRQILAEMYGSDADGVGYPGMDDQGATSSWYALSAMGFYPVDPSTDEFIIGSPLFDKVKLVMGNGETLELIAHNNSTTNMYIQSATLNGKPWNKTWFSQGDLKGGAVLTLNMGPTPSPTWGVSPDSAPPSMTEHSN